MQSATLTLQIIYAAYGPLHVTSIVGSHVNNDEPLYVLRIAYLLTRGQA